MNPSRRDQNLRQPPRFLDKQESALSASLRREGRRDAPPSAAGAASGSNRSASRNALTQSRFPTEARLAKLACRSRRRDGTLSARKRWEGQQEALAGEEGLEPPTPGFGDR